MIKKLLIMLMAVAPLTLFAQNDLTTVFEASKGKKSATYEEVIKYYKLLSQEFDEVSIEEKGMTDSGLPLHLVSIKKKGSEKLRLLINNGIHPGEPDGIDASLMFARDLLQKKHPLLDHFDIYIIPVYNIGGALNRNSTSRVNQNGPLQYGFRGNARNYDLNRDFIKADTRNTRSFYEIFHQVQPDLFIDTHVSNGADYQYNNTHLFTQQDKLGGIAGEFLYNKFIPEVTLKMTRKGDPMTPYVNVFNTTPDKGFSQFMDWPRYSTGYTALFNTIGMMIETHMLKPYGVRVKSTYDFLMSLLEAGADNKKELMALREKEAFAAIRYPLTWKLKEDSGDTINFLGYEGEYQTSNVTGHERLFYDKEKPYSKEIVYKNKFEPGLFIEVPVSYIVPQAWHNVIELLKLNKVNLSRLANDSLIEIESYKILSYNTSERPYEGHYPHNNVEVIKEIKKVQFRKGDYIVPVKQIAGRYILETLEPQAHDSFFSWNFFDTILQRKEGFSPYVFEELAEEILKNDKMLKTEFEEKRKTDQAFNGSWFAQLNFIYSRSDYAEKNYMQYPIYRLMK